MAGEGFSHYPRVVARLQRLLLTQATSKSPAPRWEEEASGLCLDHEQ